MLVDVTVKVQEERLADFYEMYAAWFASSTKRSEPGGGRVPWTRGDNEFAVSVWAKFPDKPRALLELLLIEAELDSDGIASRLGLKDASQVTGLAGWIARVCNTVGRTTPVKTRPVEGGGTAWRVEPDIAELFKQARDEAG